MCLAAVPNSRAKYLWEGGYRLLSTRWGKFGCDVNVDVESFQLKLILEKVVNDEQRGGRKRG